MLIMSDIEFKDFLFELGTEELPAKALKAMAETFKQYFLLKSSLDLRDETIAVYITPRRLVVHIPYCPSEEVVMQPVNANHPPKQGRTVQELLPDIIKKALKTLPMGKLMRWGNTDFEFSRPVKWVLMMYGNQVVEAEFFGLKAGNKTRGHRFQAPEERVIRLTDGLLDEPIDVKKKIEDVLQQFRQAKVIADFDERRDRIKTQIEKVTQSVGRAIMDESLLDEVTGIVEWPVAMLASFDKAFLNLPREAIISALQGHQKCFAVENEKRELQPYFVLVSNIEPADKTLVIQGNEKVVRARLSDAAFFFTQDQKQLLSSRIDALKKIVYQEKLGSIFDKLERMDLLAHAIAAQLKIQTALLKEAVYLSKADLTTSLVGEFPELQGIAGSHYALHDKLDVSIAQSICEHYQPRHASDALPQTEFGIVIALADRFDILLSLFSIGLKPTGTKDPYACRRAALGILKICVEHRLALNLSTLMQAYPEGVVKDVLEFMFERLHRWYLEKQSDASDIVKAVLAISPVDLYDAALRLEALTQFKSMPEALTLSAAHKRVNQILKKQGAGITADLLDSRLFVVEQEKILAEKIEKLSQEIKTSLVSQDYVGALAKLATLKSPIDDFFEKVMVMDKDEKLRQNRLSLLAKLHALFLRIADLGELQIG
jgi:glycyl-tRNA synthetase beta chain